MPIEGRKQTRDRFIYRRGMATNKIAASSFHPSKSALRERGNETMQGHFGPLVPPL